MKLRTGFVGLGGIAGAHLSHLKSNDKIQLVAGCDIVQANADRAEREYGMKSYTKFEEMLENEKLDILFVCVPPFAHENIEEMAAARGIHLLVEKPLGLDMEAIRKKSAAIRSAGIMAASGYCLRYLDIVAQAKEYLQDKPIGMVRANYMMGFVQNPWWRDIAKSGGQLVEQATHTVDLVRYLAGEVRTVYANLNLLLLKDIEGISIPDVGIVNLSFKSGAVGHIDTCCIQPDWRSETEIQGLDFRLTISGKTLTIIEKYQTHTYTSRTENNFKEQDNAFISAVITGNRNLIHSPYDDALKTVEITLAANESSKTGMPIVLNH